MAIHSQPRVTVRQLSWLALITGGFSLLMNLVPGWELLAFMLSMAALGALAAEQRRVPTRQRLSRSFEAAFEWLLLFLMAAYVVVELVPWLPGAAPTITAISTHWPGLVLAAMCALLGAASLRSRGDDGTA